MITYITRRLLLVIPTILGMTFLVFMTMALSPGGIGGSLLNDLGELDSQQGRMIRDYYDKRYGLKNPPIVQYGRWLNQVSPLGWELSRDASGDLAWGRFGFKTPDLGESMARGRPVTALFAEALPVTLTLNIITTPIIYGLAIIMGIYAARHRGRFFDNASSISMLALWSLPVIMVGTLLIGFLANREYIRLFPSSGLSSLEADHMAFLPRFGDAHGFERGWLLDRLWHLALPVLCLLYGGFAVLMKLMRASVLENLSSDFIRTARAKGVDDRTVLWGHAFRNSLLPLITVMAGVLPAGQVLALATVRVAGGVGHHRENLLAPGDGPAHA